MFTLPILSGEIPTQMGTGHLTDLTLAKLSIASNRCGMTWPAGADPKLDLLVKNQWENHLNQSFGRSLGELLGGAPEIAVETNRITFTNRAVPNINVFAAKTLVMELEAETKGLGWYVYETATRGSSHGLHIYDTSLILYHFYARYELNEFNDHDFAHAVLEEEGRDEEITEELIEELKEQYSYWPSDVLKDFEGAEHLFNPYSSQNRPKVLNAPKVKRWLKNHPQHRLAPCVADALTLDAMLSEADSKLFGWCDQETTQIGATCILCWSDPSLLFEAVQEYEQMEYSCGDAEEAYARIELTIPDTQTCDGLEPFTKSVTGYIKRWHQLEKLMSHFPLVEGYES